MRTRRFITKRLGAGALGLGSAVLSSLLTGCGYQVAGKGSTLPTKAKTIAIPAFDNLTTRYRLTQWMPEALGMEFLRRAKYTLVEDPNEADLVLRGAILNQQISPSIISDGRASMVQVNVRMQVQLIERESGKVLYRNESMEFRGQYEIAVDQRAYFDESDASMERVSQDAARTVVSRILEGF